MSVHVGLNSLTLLQWGSEDQKQRFLVPQARGREAGHLRPDRAGRRHRRRRTSATTARRDGDAYVLNGSKIWISLADIADHFLVFATVDRAKKHKGITAFIVERGMDGFSTGTIEGKLGIRAGNTGELYFDNVRVPVENRVGEEGEGFTIAMSAIDQGRFTVATGAVGLAQACLDAVGQVRARAQDVRPGDRPAPAGQADDRQDGRRASRPAGCCAGRPPGSRTAACATRARRSWPSGSAPTTPCSPRSTPSRSTAPTATPTSTRSSATCATPRRRSSTRARASCTRSSRPTTCLATAQDKPLRCPPLPAQGFEAG